MPILGKRVKTNKIKQQQQTLITSKFKCPFSETFNNKVNIASHKTKDKQNNF